MSVPAPPHPRVVAASVAGTLMGALVYFVVLLDASWRPGRTAVGLGYGSNFFDLQAQAILEGRLWLPTDSLGIEGFIIDGRTYTYFPPFPALLRIPVMVVTEEFNGRLTVLSMAVAWLVIAIMSARFLWLARRIVVGEGDPRRRDAVVAAILLAAMTGGTVLTFDAGLPWVYHEVYLWSVATVLASAYWLVRVLQEPSRWALGWLLASALAAVLTRTTGGFAVCGAIGVGAALWWLGPGRDRHDGRRVAGAILAVALIPVAVSAALNLAKFGHPYLFPLDKQVWTAVNAHRAEALAANGGHITGLQFLPGTAHAYLALDGLRFTPWFPWVSLPEQAPPVLRDGVVFDQTYRTASVFATTPLLSVLALVGVVALAWRRRRREVLLLGPPLLGAAVLPGGVLMYGYIANRYTSEFVPFLILGSAVALWTVVTPLLAHLVWARLIATALAVLTGYSMAVHAITGMTSAALVGRGDSLTRYLSLQTRVDAALGSAGPPVSISDAVDPPPLPADTLSATTACTRLLVATGDRYEPWVLAEAEPVVLRVTLGRDVTTSRATVARFVGSVARSIILEVRDDHHVRWLVQDGTSIAAGRWYGVYPGTSTTMGIGIDTGQNTVEVTSTPGGLVDVFPAYRIDAEWVIHPGSVEVSSDAAGILSGRGIELESVGGRPSTLCPRVVERVTS